MNKDLLKITKEKNAEFKAASLAEKRVMIAKDALTQIACGNFIVQHDVYVSGVGVAKDDVLGTLCNAVSCTGCAKGALTVSSLLLKNSKIKNWGRMNAIADTHGISEFPPDMWDQIESEFEGYSASKNPKSWHNAFLYSQSCAKLTAILRHIVDHDGDFIPELLHKEYPNPESVAGDQK